MICHTCRQDHTTGLQCSCGTYHCPRCFEAHQCPKPLWPHQAKGIADTWAAIEAGERRNLFVSPTGGGKTRCMKEMAARAVNRGWRVAIYNQRKLLTTQTAGVMSETDFGIMAAGHRPNLDQPIQIASIPTVWARVYQKVRWDLHKADLVFMDEAHQHLGPVSSRIMQDHLDSGAHAIVGFTATPVDCGRHYDRLIQAGVNSELRKCGALVPAITYTPDEPDLRHVRRIKTGEFVEAGMTKAIMRPGIFGRVLEHFDKLNPERLPTVVFGPDVAGSRYFADMFNSEFIPAAHIDADTPDELRQKYFDEFRTGKLVVLCNRFVMREGIDLPLVRHVIFATAFGSIQTYLQAGGRGLRACEGKDSVIIQDHGGNARRHGDLNDDIYWTLGDTNNSIRQAQLKARESGELPEPIQCPVCAGMRWSGPVCPHCGHTHKRSVRYVVEADGSLKRFYGSGTKKKRKQSALEKAANQVFWAGVNSNMTVGQMVGLFHARTGQWLHEGLIRYRGRAVPIPSKSSGAWQEKVSEFYQIAPKKSLV